MTHTQFSRKLDESGRIMIPVKLREQMQLKPKETYHFSTLEENGRKYICIDCGPIISNSDLDKAMQIVQASGLKIVQPDD